MIQEGGGSLQISYNCNDFLVCDVIVLHRINDMNDFTCKGGDT
jgi:hypothetical protein